MRFLVVKPSRLLPLPLDTRSLLSSSMLNDVSMGRKISTASYFAELAGFSEFAHNQLHPDQHSHCRLLPSPLGVGSSKVLRFSLLIQPPGPRNVLIGPSNSKFLQLLLSNPLSANSLSHVASPLFAAFLPRIEEKSNVRAGRVAGFLPLSTDSLLHSEIPLNLVCSCILSIISPGSTSKYLLLWQGRAVNTIPLNNSIYIICLHVAPVATLHSSLFASLVASSLSTVLEEFSLYLCVARLSGTLGNTGLSTMTAPPDLSCYLESTVLIDSALLSPSFDVTMSTCSLSAPPHRTPADVATVVEDSEISEQFPNEVRVHFDTKSHTPRPYSHARPLPTRTPISDFAAAAIDKHSQARDFASHTCVPVVCPDGPSSIAFCSKCRLVIPLSPKPLAITSDTSDISHFEKRASGESDSSMTSTVTVRSADFAIDLSDSPKEPIVPPKVMEPSSISPLYSNTDSGTDDPVSARACHRAFRWPPFSLEQSSSNGSKSHSSFFSYPIKKLLTQMARRRYIPPLYPWKWRRSALCGL